MEFLGIRRAFRVFVSMVFLIVLKNVIVWAMWLRPVVGNSVVLVIQAKPRLTLEWAMVGSAFQARAQFSKTFDDKLNQRLVNMGVSGAALAQPSTPLQETNGCVLALSLRHRNDIADTSAIQAKLVILMGVLTILMVFLKIRDFRILMSKINDFRIFILLLAFQTRC